MGYLNFCVNVSVKWRLGRFDLSQRFCGCCILLIRWFSVVFEDCIVAAAFFNDCSRSVREVVIYLMLIDIIPKCTGRFRYPRSHVVGINVGSSTLREPVRVTKKVPTDFSFLWSCRSPIFIGTCTVNHLF